MRILGCIFWMSLVLQAAAEQFNTFDENGKVGLKDAQGRIVIPAQYDAIGWGDGKFSIVERVTGYRLNGQWGLISIDNHRITKPDFVNLYPGEGLYIVAYKKNASALRALAGCVNTSGKEIIPFQYDGVIISSLRAIVFIRSGNKFNYGLIDFDNKKIIPLQYKDIHSIGSLRFAVQNFQNKTALFTEAGKQITEFVIDSISLFRKDFAILYQDKMQGLLHRDGQIKVRPLYRSIRVEEDGTVKGKQIDDWSFLNEKNQIQKRVQADSIVPVQKDLYKVENAGQVLLVDKDFKSVTKTPFSWLGTFHDDEAVFKCANKYGLVKKNGSIVIDATADKMIVDSHFVLADQRQGGRDQWFLLDSVGNRQNTKAYDQIGRWNGRFFPVKSRLHWGAINQKGKEIIACAHDSLIQSLDNNVVVKFHGQYGIINLKEDWLVTPQPNKLQLVSGDRYLEFTEQNTFLKSIDRQIIYFSSNKMDIQDGYLLEHLPSGAIWQIDLQGRIVNREAQTDKAVEKVFPEREGLRGIKKDGKYGFIDSRGRIRIANRYDDIQNFQEEMAAIKINGKWGFINHQERIVVQPAYEEVTPFKKGFSIVRQKGLSGLIDKTGKIILPVRYQSLEVLPNQRIRILQDGVYGLSTADGHMILNPRYEMLEDLDNGFVIVARDQKYSLLTLQGLSIIPMIYDSLMYDRFNDIYIALRRSDWVTIKL